MTVPLKPGVTSSRRSISPYSFVACWKNSDAIAPTLVARLLQIVEEVISNRPRRARYSTTTSCAKGGLN